MNKDRHHDLSAMSKQFIDYLQANIFSELALPSQSNEVPQHHSEDNIVPIPSQAEENPPEIDWEVVFHSVCLE